MSAEETVLVQVDSDLMYKTKRQLGVNMDILNDIISHLHAPENIKDSLYEEYLIRERNKNKELANKISDICPSPF